MFNPLDDFFKNVLPASNPHSGFVVKWFAKPYCKVVELDEEVIEEKHYQ
jgi:hypothetical protein